MNKNSAYYLLTLGFCVLLYYGSYSLKMDASGFVTGDPRIYPRIVIVATLALCVIGLLVEGYKGWAHGRSASAPAEGKFWQSAWTRNWRAFTIFALFAVYVIAMTKIHFIAPTIIFMVVTQGLLYGIEGKKLWLNALITVIGTFGIYAAFVHGLKIPMP